MSGNLPWPDTADPVALSGFAPEVEFVWFSFQCLVIETGRIPASHRVLDRVAG